ncbi:hypothetical protein QZH41_016851 [Actinostola sp. cb2023]|nr:hypothetical protein QZH41_016851 [Actinostola sp. cb2023]
MSSNGVNGDGQNINTKWFSEGEYLWRTGASVTWLILCLPCALLALIGTVSINIFHPIIWLSDVFNTLFAVHFWLIVIFYGIITAILALSSNKFNSVQDVIHRNRISSVLYLIHPSHVLHMFLFCVCGMLSAWSMLNILGKPFDSLTVFSDQSEDECFLNEYGMFVVVFGGWLGFYTSLQYFITKEFHFTFPTTQQRKFFCVKAAVRPSIYKAILLTFKAVRWYYPLYYIFGNISKRMIATFLVATPDRNSLPLDSLTGLFNLYMFWVVMCLGTLLSFIWVFGNVLFVIYNTQVYEFPIESAQEQCLPAMIKSKSVPLLRYLAFLDLYQLSQFSSQRRKQIFSLTQPGGRPANWTSLYAECVSVLNGFTAELNAHIEYETYQRQQITGQWAHGNTSINKHIDTATSPTNSPIGIINSSPHRTRLWTSLVGESNAVRRGVSSPHETSVSSTTLNNYSPNPVYKVAEVNTLQWRIRQIPHNFAVFMRERPVIAYLFNELPGYRAEAMFSDCQLQIWVVQGLCRLVVASFTEDTFGVVQMGAHSKFSCISIYFQALDRFAKFPTAGRCGIQPRPPRPQGKEGMRYSLRAGLVSSIYHITNTFGRHLDGIPLSYEHRARLKGFIENREP